MARDVARYLARVREAAAAESVVTGRLAEMREALARSSEGRETETAAALAHLAAKRLLASSTLQATNPGDRLRWDEANRWLHERVSRGVRLRTEELVALNAVVTGTPSGLRTERVYSPPDEYLPPEHVAGELTEVDRWVEEGEKTDAGDEVGAEPGFAAGEAAPPSSTALRQAAVVYVAVVTIHPFVDGNGRTARLAADRLLLGGGWLPLCFLSPIAAHVAQMAGGRPRDPAKSVERVLAAVAESYATVLARLA